MKIQDLYERSSSNTSVEGVLRTIASIYQGTRPRTSARLCHATTAANIDPARPQDEIVLYGYGDTVVHSALLSNGKLFDQYGGVSSSKLLPSGNLRVELSPGHYDELEPVYRISVDHFLQQIGASDD